VAPPADLKRDVVVKLTDFAIDSAARTITVTAVLVNTAAMAIDGPLRAVLTELTSSLDSVRATNASNGKAGVGAAWTIPVGRGSVLAARATSAPWTMKWTYAGAGPNTADLSRLFVATLGVERDR
jgi:hypothetical protein